MKPILYALLFVLLHSTSINAQNQHLVTVAELKELARCPDQNCFLALINPWEFKYKATKKGKLNKQEGTQYRYVRPYPNPLFAEATASYWIMNDNTRRVVFSSDNKDWIASLSDVIQQNGFTKTGSHDTFTADEDELVLSENGLTWHLVWNRPTLSTMAPHTLTLYHDLVPPGRVPAYVANQPDQPTPSISAPARTAGLSSPGGNWDSSYPVQDVANVLSAERTYVTTYDRKNGKTGHTFYRVEKMRIQAKFLNQYRPMTVERWSTSFDLPIRRSGFDAFADNRARLFRQEALFEAGGEQIWMPMQELLIAPMQKLATTGQSVTLYALLVSYHDFGGTLHLSFLINEYAVQAERPAPADESPYAHLIKEDPPVTTNLSSNSRQLSFKPKNTITQKKLSGDLNYTMRKVERHYYRKNSKGDTIAIANAEFDFPEFNELKLNQLIRNKLVGASTYESVSQRIVDEYKEEIVRLNEEALRGSMGGTHRTEKVTVIKDTPHFVVLNNNHSAYGAGAAHANYGESYWLYEKQSKRFLLLSDLFSYSGLVDLAITAETIFRRKEKISSQYSLCKNYLFDNCRFTLAKQFRLDRRALTFVYNPYEGKSFAAGIWTLTLPYTLIKKYFRPEVWQLIQQEIVDIRDPDVLSPAEPNTAVIVTSGPLKPEDFRAFIQRFSTDEEFQLKRVKFPFRREGFYDYEEKPEVTLTHRIGWKQVDYNKPSFIGQGVKGVGNWTIGKGNDKETGVKAMRACGCQNCECGYFMHHEFKQISGKWFLIKEVIVSN